jgi:NitT/TauT family transport system substrate-binding protein
MHRHSRGIRAITIPGLAHASHGSVCRFFAAAELLALIPWPAPQRSRIEARIAWKERPLRLSLLAFLMFAFAVLAGHPAAHATTKVKVGVLKFGTVSWVLDVIQHNGLDKAEGIELDIVPLASTDATAIGLQGGSVDIIATDWLWVSRERSGGADFTFSPFTTALGAIMVPPNSPIKTLTDLKGKSLGVAGGPIDKSWLLTVAYALRTANLDLRTETTQEYGAPPLLTERAKQGAVDAVLDFWPFAARLEAQGFKQLLGVEEVVSELGAKGEVAMVGYVFSESFAKANADGVAGFLRAAAKADELLATSNEEWQRIRPLMQVEDDATFEALRRRYREGIPERSVAENEADAKVLYQFLRELGGQKLVGPATELAPGTFWKGGKN